MSMKPGLALRVSAAFAGLLLASSAVTSAAAASTVVVGAKVVDGGGGAARSVSVRIDGDRITAVGRFKPRRGETVVRARGLVLAPGFVDSHSHHDRGDFAERAMPPLLAQGVTTVVVGEDGYGSAPIAQVAAKFTAKPASINIASYTGHGWLRDQVLGADYKRHATPAEVEKMQGLIEADMAAGSLGLSTGLEYDPGIYSSHEELLALAGTAAASGGRYISHMRSEDVAFDAALDELLDIGRKTGMPVQISHLKLGIVDRWGQAPQVLAKLDKARAEGLKVTADVYPYEYWQSNLSVLLPNRDFTDLTAARFALTKLTTPEGMLLGSYAPEPTFAGQTIAQIAAQRHEEPAVTYLWLINRAEDYHKAHPEVDDVESVIGTAMAPQDVADFIAWPNANVCSDGMLHSRHPRGTGAFAKVLRLYVREQHRLSLEQAVHKMTVLSAEHVGLPLRGLIKPGYFADLVLFDPDTITDHSSIKTPTAVATGVSSVWVNGALVYDHGKPTEVYSGRFLKRGGVK